MKKKILILLMAIVSCLSLAFGLAACGDNDSAGSGSQGTGTTQNPTGSGSQGTTHTHSWSSTYVNGGDRHYQTCSGCTEKKYSGHSYNSIGYCICGKEKPVEEHVHTWSYNQDYNDFEHKLECKGCGDYQVEEHNLQGDVCKICKKDFSGYVRVVPIGQNSVKLFEKKIKKDGTIDLGEDVRTNPYSNSYLQLYYDEQCLRPINNPVFDKRTTVYLRDYNVNFLLPYCTFSVANGQATLTNVYSVVKNQPVIILPKFYNGLPVTKIGESVFSGGTMREVILIDGVTTIGANAFSSCGGLTHITIPNSVTSIESSAFISCSSLTSVTIPSSVTTIGANAFGQCALTSVTIPSSVTTIGANAFYNCSELTEIKFNVIKSKSVDGIFYGAGQNGEGIKVTIGKDVEAIPNSLFCVSDSRGYAKITSMEFEKGSVCTSIGTNLFDQWVKLTEVRFPDWKTMFNISGIGNLMKSGSDKKLYVDNKLVTQPVIPNGVGTIKEYMFYGCRGLTSVTIPSGVTSIGDSAFSGCSSLTSVTIPSGVTSIGRAAFYGCSSLMSVTIPDSVTSIGDSAFSACSSLTSVTIPDSVTSIGDYVFSDCSSLTSVTIGSGVRSIGWYAFYRCNNLTNATFKNPNGWWIYYNKNINNKTAVSSEKLADPSTAAALLLDRWDYAWVR